MPDATPTICPRCGQPYDPATRAGSRVAVDRDVDVCGRCAAFEADRERWGWDPVPMSAWPLRPHEAGRELAASVSESQGRHLPPRRIPTELLAAVTAALDIDPDEADRARVLVTAAEPLWRALESFGMVDGYGGAECRRVLPAMLAFAHREANAGPFSDVSAMVTQTDDDRPPVVVVQGDAETGALKSSTLTVSAVMALLDGTPPTEPADCATCPRSFIPAEEGFGASGGVIACGECIAGALDSAMSPDD